MMAFHIRNLPTPEARRIARRVLRHMLWYSQRRASNYASPGYHVRDIPGVIWDNKAGWQIR